MISALVNNVLTTANGGDGDCSSMLIHQCRDVLGKLFPSANLHETYIQPCTGGITNKLFKAVIKSEGKVVQSVLIRIYGRGTDAIIDRETELRNMRLLCEQGLAGRLYGVFENGFVYEYIEGTALTCDELPVHMELVARELAKWHSIRPDSSLANVSPSLFKTLRRWLDKVHRDDLDDASRLSYLHHINSLESKYKDAVAVLCHNDVLSANVILCPDAQSVKFIDYEYSAFSIAAFDLANHFCEYAGFDCDWGKLPTDEQMVRFVKAYNPALSNHQIDDFMATIKDFMPAAHLFWGLWGLIQSRLSDIDFDYTTYAHKRLAMIPPQPAPQ